MKTAVRAPQGAPGLPLGRRTAASASASTCRAPGEQLRLTVAARRETAAKLIEAGMSQREAAKALGVGQSTIRDDLRGTHSKSSGNHSTKAERRAQREFERPRREFGVVYDDVPASRREETRPSHATIAQSATASRVLREAPSRAWIDMPCWTVA